MNPEKSETKRNHLWWKGMLRQYRLKHQQQLLAQNREDRNVLWGLLKAQLKEAKTIEDGNRVSSYVTAFRRLNENTMALSYYQGLQRGLRLGELIASIDSKKLIASGDSKKESRDDLDTWLAVIETIGRNPKDSTRKLCIRLDERKPPVKPPKKWRDRYSRWQDVFDGHRDLLEPYISRRRKEAKLLERAGWWKKFKREHAKARERR